MNGKDGDSDRRWRRIKAGKLDKMQWRGKEEGKASKLQTNNIEIDINERMSCEKKGLFDLLICNCDLMMRAEL